MIASDSEQNASLLTSFFNYIGTLISGFFSSIWQFFAGGNNTESNEQPVTPPLPGNVTNGQSGAEENKNSTDASWAGKSGIFENKIASGDNPKKLKVNITPKTNQSNLLNCFFSNNYGNSNTIQDNQSDSQSVASETSNDSSVISNILTYLRF